MPQRWSGRQSAAQEPTPPSQLITLAILEDALKIFSTSKLWRSSLHFASSSSLEGPHEEQVWLAVGNIILDTRFRH